MKTVVLAEQRNRIHPHKFTMWVAIASIVMMFAGLTSAYIVKASQVNFVTIDMPMMFWYSTIVIVASSITMQMALRAFKDREMSRYRILMPVTALLGIVFVLLQFFGFSELWNSGIRFRGSGAEQFIYIIAGLHAIHVFGGIIALLVMTLKALFGKVKTYSPVGVEVATTYWHFVDGLWIYLMVFFLLIG